MVNLNLSPDAVLTLSHGDLVSVDGVEMLFEESADPNEVFITTVNHPINDYYDLQQMMSGGELHCDTEQSADEVAERLKHIRHLRDRVSYVAMMSRQEMYQCLTSDQYMIA